MEHYESLREKVDEYLDSNANFGQLFQKIDESQKPQLISTAYSKLMQKSPGASTIDMIKLRIEKMADDRVELMKTLQPHFREKTEIFIDAMVEEAKLSDASERLGKNASGPCESYSKMDRIACELQKKGFSN